MQNENNSAEDAESLPIPESRESSGSFSEQDIWNVRTVGGRIRKLMEINSMKGMDLARELETTPAVVYRWINSQNPDAVLQVRTARKLGDIFGVTPDFFHFAEKPGKPDSLEMEQIPDYMICDNDTERQILDGMIHCGKTQNVYAVMHNTMMENPDFPRQTIFQWDIVMLGVAEVYEPRELLGMTVLQIDGNGDKKYGILEYSYERKRYEGRPLNPAYPPFAINTDSLRGWVVRTFTIRNYGSRGGI